MTYVKEFPVDDLKIDKSFFDSLGEDLVHIQATSWEMERCSS